MNRSSSAVAVPTPNLQVQLHRPSPLDASTRERMGRFLRRAPHPSRNLAWLDIFSRAFGHRPFVLEATVGDETVGILALAEVKSLFFGKFLVSLPYLNVGGVWTEDRDVAARLIDEAIQLADRLNVRYLELRHENKQAHPQLTRQLTSKVHLRLALPTSTEVLWSDFKSKLRSQIRKAQGQHFTIHWGGQELLDDFYRVFSRNMRDLGTPVYGKELFRAILTGLDGQAELCCLRSAGRPASAALLIHGNEISEVPSASSLREFKSTNVNMMMYWCLLQRAIGHGSRQFDFGRSTRGSNTYRFKTQWGATPMPAVWQYYVRTGECDALRPENGKYSLAIEFWKRLPVTLSRWIGPSIVRGIP